MEFGMDCDIVGEIMIPLDNNLGENNQHKSQLLKSKSNPLSFRLETILEKNFKDFRSILFQGELLRLFIVIKIEKNKDINLKDFMNSVYIKFDLDSSCDQNEIELRKVEETFGESLNNNQKSSYEDNDSSHLMTDLDKNISDLFSIHRSSIFNNFSQNSNTNYNYQNRDYDFISRKIIIEDKNIIVFEVIRHIIVPNKYLNKNLILKVNIMKKNETDFIKNYSLTDILNSGIHESIKEFTIIKTLFKEVKIIRPLFLSKTKQIDILPDTTLLQIKMENITSSINFIDKNLKASKFLNSESVDDADVLNFGISLIIKEIQILKEETVIDRKTTINVKSYEQYIKDDSIPLNNFHFSLLNENFPIEIKPGEELVITIKVFKSAFIYEKIAANKEEVSCTISSKSSSSAVGLITQNLLRSQINVTNMTNKISSISNKNNSSKYLNAQPTLRQFGKDGERRNSNGSIVSKVNQSGPNNSLSSQIQQIKQISNTINQDEVYLVENDEIIKVVLSTPIILNISSFKFYDSLFMSIPIKWHNEITRFLKLEIEIQENIELHEYFSINLKAKNISNGSMDLILEISDSSLDFMENNAVLDTEIFDYKGKR